MPAITLRSPRASSCNTVWSKGGNCPSEKSIHTRSTAPSTVTMTSSCRSGHAPAVRGRSSEESSANTDATSRPTVVDAVQPRLVTSISTIGVVSACTARKPALAMNAHATRKMRASSWVCAAWAIRTPIPPAMTAVVTTRPKWASWCSHRTSAPGSASSSQRPRMGRERCMTQTAGRNGEDRRRVIRDRVGVRSAGTRSSSTGDGVRAATRSRR